MYEKQTKLNPDAGFLVMAFTEETAGDEALKALEAAKLHHQFYFESAAVIRQDASGKAQYRETGDTSIREGAGVGALIGGTLGVLGGPIGIVIGAGIGGAIGAAAAQYDDGFKNEGLHNFGVALKPGTSAVIAVTSDDFLRSVQKQVAIEDIRQFVSDLAVEISASLNEGKSVALKFFLVGSELSFKEAAASINSAELVAKMLALGTAASNEYHAAIKQGKVSKAGDLTVDDAVAKTDETADVDHDR
jgi:uncharacterized membrane protein